MSPDVKHNIFRVALYVAIFLIIAYFFTVILDNNKKITYTTMQEINISNAAKLTILNDNKKLLVEDKNGRLFIVEKFDKSTLDYSGVSYGYENQILDEIIKYVLSAALFVCVILLSIT